MSWCNNDSVFTEAVTEEGYVRYLGGKSRLAKKFASILVAALPMHNGIFYEPFVGGFNVVPTLVNHLEVAICSDIHPGLIAMYRALQDGWEPPTEVSREDYYYIKGHSAAFQPEMAAFVGFGCSYSGKEWGGYASGEGRNYAKEAHDNLMTRLPDIKNCTFHWASYDGVPLYSETAVIYCDPPYRSTTGYKTGEFDHTEFDRWCENRALVGHTVFVSEFNAPEHWEVVWEHERALHCDGRGANKDADAPKSQKRATERLYRVVPR